MASRVHKADTMDGKRFLMSVHGRHLDDIKTLRDVVAQIDTAKLAAPK